MDLFDKIGNIAKNIGDRTNDAIEITKLNAKIATEKSAVAEDLKNIGEFYYKKFAYEEPIDTVIQEFCDNAASHYEAIDQAQAEIERIKKENGVNKESSGQEEPKKDDEAKEEAEACEKEPEPESMVVCPNCQAVNPEGLKFCTQCGSSLEPEKAVKEEDKKETAKCPVCGEPLNKDSKFCGHCGATITPQ